MFKGTVKINTLPTEARILINGKEIGISPLKYTFKHEDERTVNIKAIPLYPNQYTQNIFLRIPPVPKRFTIYMNHYPETYDHEKEREFVPPEKPKPIVIVETKVDTVYMEKIVEKIVDTCVALKLPEVYFELDSDQLSPQEAPKMLQVIEIMTTYPEYDLEINGYADIRASQAYNMKLSLRRAENLKKYLIDNGIAESRLKTYAHGAVTVIDSEGKEVEYSKARRVSFVLK